MMYGPPVMVSEVALVLKRLPVDVDVLLLLYERRRCNAATRSGAVVWSFVEKVRARSRRKFYNYFMCSWTSVLPNVSERT